MTPSNAYQAAWTPISGTFDGKALTDAESFGGSLVQTVTINTEGTGYDVPVAAGVEPSLRLRRPRISRYSSSTRAGGSSAQRQTHRTASRPIRGWNSISPRAGPTTSPSKTCPAPIPA